MQGGGYASSIQQLDQGSSKTVALCYLSSSLGQSIGLALSWCSGNLCGMKEWSGVFLGHSVFMGRGSVQSWGRVVMLPRHLHDTLCVALVRKPCPPSFHSIWHLPESEGPCDLLNFGFSMWVQEANYLLSIQSWLLSLARISRKC